MYADIKHKYLYKCSHMRNREYYESIKNAYLMYAREVREASLRDLKNELEFTSPWQGKEQEWWGRCCWRKTCGGFSGKKVGTFDEVK